MTIETVEKSKRDVTRIVADLMINIVAIETETGSGIENANENVNVNVIENVNAPVEKRRETKTETKTEVEATKTMSARNLPRVIVLKLIILEFLELTTMKLPT